VKKNGFIAEGVPGFVVIRYSLQNLSRFAGEGAIESCSIFTE
jgi:hypothetical protein